MKRPGYSEEDANLRRRVSWDSGVRRGSVLSRRVGAVRSQDRDAKEMSRFVRDSRTHLHFFLGAGACVAVRLGLAVGAVAGGAMGWLSMELFRFQMYTPQVRPGGH